MFGLELEDVAGAGSPQVLVDLRNHRTATDLVEVVGCRQAIDGLALVRAVDVDGHLVAVFGGPVHGLERRVPAAEQVEPAVDVGVGGEGHRYHDPERAVTCH